MLPVERPTAPALPALSVNEVVTTSVVALTPEDSDAILDFLNSLVLYSLDTLPCDVDGDGVIAEHFMVAGKDTGRETFNPERLFRVPGEIEGVPQGIGSGPTLDDGRQIEHREGYCHDCTVS